MFWCLGVHTLVLVYIHALVICWFFSLLQERIMFTHYCTLSRSLAATCTACNLHAVYIDDCTPPVCIIICTQNTTCTLSSLTYVQLCIIIHTQHTIDAHMNTRASIIRCQSMEKAMTWEGTKLWKPFTLAMPPNNITILAICTVLCICAGGRSVCKLVHHHIPNTKLTQRDDNIRILPARASTDTQAASTSMRARG